jgi:methylated-DNA-[protein]-cysteine S-methyltransferase
VRADSSRAIVPLAFGSGRGRRSASEQGSVNVLELSRYTLFETAIGTCAAAFTRRGISMVGLPEASRRDLAARFDQHADRADRPLPAFVERAVDALAAHLRGELQDLTELELDLDAVPAFDKRVYELTRRIPPGRTRTYGELATDLGETGLARAVGQSLGRNPVPLIVPCHRVVRTDGELGGFSAAGGTALKLRLLAIEGAGGLQLGMRFD